jgi:hypothetical protein
VSDLLARLADAWRGPLTLDPLDLAVSLLCALCCGFVISETYRRSHRGLDYSRPFVQVLLLCTVIVAFVTLVVGDDLARAFTLVGALSVIRYRTAVKEPRDLAFIFWAVAVGMGAGSRFLTFTIVFTLGVMVVIVALVAAGYGVKDMGLKVLRLRLDSAANYDEVFGECFGTFLADHRRLSVGLVRQGALYELVFVIRLKADATERDFVEAIRKVVGDHPVTLSGRDDETAF